MFSPQVTTDVVKAAEKVNNVDDQEGRRGHLRAHGPRPEQRGPVRPGELRRRRREGAARPPGVPARRAAPGDRRQADQAGQRPTPRSATRSSRPRAPRATTRSSPRTAPPSTPRSTRPSRSTLLKQAGVKTPVNVRMMYAKDNVASRQRVPADASRRSAKAGFNLIDAGSPDWSEKLGDGSYDAVFFGWQSTTPAVSADRGTYATGAINNFVGYSNKTVDEPVRPAGAHLGPGRAGQDPDADRASRCSRTRSASPIFQFPSANIANKTRDLERGSRHPGADDVLRVLELEGAVSQLTLTAGNHPP